jgi:hypothetical protein
VRRGLVLSLLLLLCTGCAPRSERSARAPLTERQRDSLLAHSRLPGASVAGRAMAISDRAAKRAAAMDAEADSLFR